jgi:hypothetical protein
MVDAVVLEDFTEHGKHHRKGEQLTLSSDDYERLVQEGVIGPTEDDNVIGPTGDGD